MATRFTLHKDGKPVAPARAVWGDAYEDLRMTAIVKVWPLKRAGKDLIKEDPRKAVTMDFTRGYAIVVTT